MGVGDGEGVDGGKKWFCFGEGCVCVSAYMRKYVCIG